MNGRMRGDISLNAPLSVAGEGDEWEDWLADPCPDPESLLLEGSDREQKKTALDQALAELSARERSILEARFLTEEPKTLDELAAVFHVRAKNPANRTACAPAPQGEDRRSLKASDAVRPASL